LAVKNVKLFSCGFQEPVAKYEKRLHEEGQFSAFSIKYGVHKKGERDNEISWVSWNVTIFTYRLTATYDDSMHIM